MIFTDKQLEEIVELLTSLNDDTKLYLGCDSRKFKEKGVWYAKYAVVLVIRKNGNKGCKIFSKTVKERDFDKKKDRPALRLMREVQLVAELYQQLVPFVGGYHLEIHLDINPDPRHGSSCVASQAAGYILGVTGDIEPKLKPESWASSFGADGIERGFHTREPSKHRRRCARL